MLYNWYLDTFIKTRIKCTENVLKLRKKIFFSFLVSEIKFKIPITLIAVL